MPSKTSNPTPTREATIAGPSSGRPGSSRNGQYVAITIRNGATNRIPPMSPSHHVRQTEAAWSVNWSPAARLATPIVAAIVVLITPARRTSMKTSASRGSRGRKPPRRRSQAPTSASSVFPTVIPRVV